MSGPRPSLSLTRRTVLGGAALGAIAVLVPPAAATAEESSLLNGLFGALPTLSERVRLDMPPKFSSGYTVPLNLTIDVGSAEPLAPADTLMIAIVGD